MGGSGLQPVDELAVRRFSARLDQLVERRHLVRALQLGIEVSKGDPLFHLVGLHLARGFGVPNDLPGREIVVFMRLQS